MTQQRSQPTQIPYLFENVFQNLCKRFWKNIVVPEITNICKMHTSQTKPKSSELFEVFPRSNNFYKQMILDLTEIAKYKNSGCLHYLKNSIGEIVMLKKHRTFDGLNKDLPKDQLAYEIVRSLELLLITDLICNIISNLQTIDKPTSLGLINCGIYLCMSPPSKDDFPNILLKQWAVIFSRISILRPSDIFETLTQLIINKYDYFFKLMKYVRLDSNDKDSHSNDILEIMTSHVKRAKMKKCLTASMLFSLSTLLITYQGQSPCIKQILDIAKPLIEKDPNDNPGAVDLIATLLRYTDWTQEDIDKFYKDKVYPLTNNPDGILAAAHAFRVLMFNDHLDPNFLFYVWGPTTRGNTFDFLNWKVVGDVNYLTETFMHNYFESPYFSTCSSIFTEIIVRLAAMDFDVFLKDISSEFFKKDIDSAQFKVFLNIVPMINDRQFIEISKVSRDMIDKFNDDFAQNTNNKMQSIIKTLTNYGISITNDYRSKVNKASETVAKIHKTYGINIGEDTNSAYIDASLAFQTAAKKINDNSRRIVMIFPYIVNSSMFQTNEWMEDFTRLAALSDEDVSKPAYAICQSIFQHAKKRLDFCNVLVRMAAEINQQMEIFYICTKMLIELTDYLEPHTPSDPDAIEYRMELVAILGLASDFPFIRESAYDLLIRVNKLLQNQGLYSELEDQMPSVESNVNHNIIMQKFPKIPGSNVYFEEDLKIDHYMYSCYNEAWLFFLAEIGRLVFIYQFTELLSGLEKFSTEYANRIDEINEKKPNHMSIGLLVLFLSTCVDQDYTEEKNSYADGSQNFYEISNSYWKNIEKIIRSCFEKNNELIFIALQHTNYTIAPKVFGILKAILTNAPHEDESTLTNTFIKLLPAIHLMQCSIDAGDKSKTKIIPDARDIYFIVCSHQPTIDYFTCLFDRFNDEQTFIRNEMATLCFINFLNFVMDSYDTSYLQNANKANAANYLWQYILKLMQLPDSENNKYIPIKTYISNLLQTIVNKAIKIIPHCKDWDIKVISNCEKYGYHVLYQLLKNEPHDNFDYFRIFVDSCFRRKGLMADEFFSAIFKVLFPDKRDTNENNVNEHRNVKESEDNDYHLLFEKQSGNLLLLALFRVKMGSPLAKRFFIKFYDQCPYKSSQKKGTKSEIMNNPVEYLERLAEMLVKNALIQMQHEKFKGTLKVMNELLTPWIKKFRLVPKNKVCIPTSISKKNYSPEEFLHDLMVVTKIYRSNHDFQKIIDIWKILLKEPENQYMTLPFIAEYPYSFNNKLKKDNEKDANEIAEDIDLKCELFSQLMNCDYLEPIILKILTKRCKFSFYAYITYQQKKDMNDQFWIVDLLEYALKTNKKAVTSRIPIIIQFAILFHSDQTQYLMKLLAKRYSIDYNRRALSSILIAKMVTLFKDEIEKEEKNEKQPRAAEASAKQTEIESSQEDELTIDSDEHIQSKDLHEEPPIATNDQVISGNESRITFLNIHNTRAQSTTEQSTKNANQNECYNNATINQEAPFISSKNSKDTINIYELNPEHVKRPSSTVPQLLLNTSSSTFTESSSIKIDALNPRETAGINNDSSSMKVPTIGSRFPSNSAIQLPQTPDAGHTTSPFFSDLGKPKLIPSKSVFEIPRQQSAQIPYVPLIVKKLPAVTRWALEAIRWTIGTQKLRLAHLSLVILNALQPQGLDDKIIEQMLYGVCRSTTYFLHMTNEKDDKSLLYDFIDETFVLFTQHFKAKLVFQYVSSFFTFNVQVDAYFEKMLPLYDKLLNDKTTKNDMEKNLLQALRPCFNELEGDQAVHDSFEKFVDQLPDLKFVEIVLDKSSNYIDIIEKADDEQLNRAFVSFSLMITNASAEMKKRIFIVSTEIIKALQRKKGDLRQSANERNDTDENDNDTGDLPSAKNESNKNENMESDKLEDDRDDSTQALLVIFKVASDSIPWMPEALTFIKAISSFYPLIPGVVPLNDVSWTYAASKVIKAIYNFLPKENISSVMFVNCKKLNTISSLMLIPIMPTSVSLPSDLSSSHLQDQVVLSSLPESMKVTYKIYPYSPMFEIAAPKRTNRFNSIIKKVCRVSQQFKDKLTCPVSPKVKELPQGNWDKLKPFQQFIQEDLSIKKSKDANMFVKFSEFYEKK